MGQKYEQIHFVMSNTYPHTPEEYEETQSVFAMIAEREELESSIWESYRDIHGIKPRWMKFSEWSLEELRSENASLQNYYLAERAREVEAAKQKVKEKNARALERRKFDSAFNSFGAALAGI